MSNIIKETEYQYKKTDVYKDVYILGEMINNQLNDITYELLSKGRELADSLNEKLALILIGNIEETEKEKLNQYGVDIVYICPLHMQKYDCIEYVKIIKNIVDKNKPSIILFPATSLGREIAPYLASKCNTGITADCTKLDIDEETKLLKQTRPTFGGKMLATITIPNHRPQICTVRPGIFNKKKVMQNNGKIEYILEEKEINSNLAKKILKEIKLQEKNFVLENAEIIISGGMGLGNKHGFELIRKLAELLNGQIATTRACVEEGWIESKYQIGQTGINVSPKIYIACGISGAIQHMAGIKNSNYIIAINKDKNAPIFEYADYGIVGNLYEIVPKIINELGEKR